MEELILSQDSTLASLLQLAAQTRSMASAAELRFLLLNKTITLMPYRQAVFWTHAKGIEGVSGVSHVDQNSTFVQWLQRFLQKAPPIQDRLSFQTDLRLLEHNNEWQDWLPSHVAVVNLPAKERFSGGRAVFFREQAFHKQELELLEEWTDIWQHEYTKFLPKPSWIKSIFHQSMSKKSRYLSLAVGGALAIGIAAMPVHQSILAPTELVPLKPTIVRAPMDGIVKAMHVIPGQRVQKGDVLFEFDRILLMNQLEQAQRSLNTTEAEYKSASQQALFKPESKAQLAVLKNKIEERRVEVNHLQQLNQRSSVKASRDGLVLIDDESEWLGKPVTTGEKVLTLADEHQVIMESWISTQDLIPLKKGDEVTLYLSADPVHPLQGKLLYIASQPQLRPDNHYAYRTRSTLVTSSRQAQVGLKGTARINGEKVSLIYWIIRKPWAAMRTWLGI